MKRLLIIFIALVILAGCGGDDIKIGKVWKYPYEDKNPFYEDAFYFEVLDYKDGYVKYKNIETGMVRSSSEHYFKIGAKPIKQPTPEPEK